MEKLEVMMQRLRPFAAHGYWADRIVGELTAAVQFNDLSGDLYTQAIAEAAAPLLESVDKQRTLPPELAQQAEARLAAVLSEPMKKYRLFCLAHAHIDMNWQWSYDETVAVTVDTFRTMLDLMQEYPAFTFSQSQASAYECIAEYAPTEMLSEIADRVREGRWEVTASTWVEADKNMPSAESVARHLLVTRRYLEKLLGLDGDQLNISFEPDTFGHSAHMPELLSEGGVKYFYHCRGSESPAYGWWQSPSGARLLTYLDPCFYNGVVDGSFADHLFPLCQKFGLDIGIRLYGVGDHGGGPSRRDIERLLDMQRWPVYPTLVFGTYQAFFRELEERFGDQLPVFNTELNAVFTGCYTSQSRIKNANRTGEAVLGEAELFAAEAALETGAAYPGKRFTEAWKKLLFNQFHDILTGSGVIDTREYAMGTFQQLMATANTARSSAMRALAAHTDTLAYASDFDPETVNAGAGVGLGAGQFKVTAVGRGSHKVRVFQVFNPLPYPRTELAEIAVWDWPEAETPLMEFRNAQDELLPHLLLSERTERYWLNRLVRVLVPVTVPACGWTVVTLRRSETQITPFGRDALQTRTSRPYEFVLENVRLRVVFDQQTGGIVSFYDKLAGEERIPAGQEAGIRIIEEDPDYEMTAWRVGRYMNIGKLTDIRLKHAFYGGAQLRQAITVTGVWKSSRVKLTVWLDAGSPVLQMEADCDWQERGVRKDRVPQLNFVMPVGKPTATYRYDIPGGIITRPDTLLNQPGCSFIASCSGDDRDLMLWSADRYGFRGTDDSLSLALIRSSYEPDPDPEIGRHIARFAVALTATEDAAALCRLSAQLAHPLSVVATSAHPGSRPATDSLLALADDSAVLLQAVKMPEDGTTNTLVIRLCNTSSEPQTAAVQLGQAIRRAVYADVHERAKEQGAITFTEGSLTVPVAAHTVATVLVTLE